MPDPHGGKPPYQSATDISQQTGGVPAPGMVLRPMESVISISEVVDTRVNHTGPVEICAAIQGAYDRARSQLVAQLDSYLQQPPLTERYRPKWLPAAETLREHVPKDEAAEVARDMFHGWVRRVRKAIPPAGSPELTAPFGDAEKDH